MLCCECSVAELEGQTSSCSSLSSAPPPSSTPDNTSNATSPVPQSAAVKNVMTPSSRNPRKRKDVDELIVESLKSIRERREEKRGRTEEPLDEAGHFGHQVAATLRRFTNRQKAIAKLQIQQVLVSVEFPPDNQ